MAPVHGEPEAEDVRANEENRASMRQKEDIANILKVMDLMANLELKIAEFYRECGASRPTEKELWSSLERDEMGHAQMIRKMAEIFLHRPEQFEGNRPFNVISVSVAWAGVQNHLRALKEGRLRGRNLLFIARDIEKALLEAKPGEILKSRDVEYQNLFQTMVSQTQTHQRTLENKIGELKRSQAA
jgi:rubrerythrin